MAPGAPLGFGWSWMEAELWLALLAPLGAAQSEECAHEPLAFNLLSTLFAGARGVQSCLA